MKKSLTHQEPQLSFIQPENSSPKPARTRNDDLSRQVRNLLLVFPITRLEVEKVRLGPEKANLFEGIDTLYLAFSLFDYISECMLFEQGADREGIIDHLFNEVGRFKKDQSDKHKRLIASIVLDQLCNSKDNHKSFRFDYFDPVEDQMKSRDFRLLLYRVTDSGEGRYLLTNEGFTAYLAMLELNTEMGQEVDEYLIKRLMERGNFRDAVRIAQRNRKRTIELKDTLERKVFKMHREIQNIDWGSEIRPFLERSREHIKERIEEEGNLLGRIDEYTRETDVEQLQEALELKETLLDCQSKHRELHSHLMKVNETFLDAQSKAFRAPRGSSYVDFEDDILKQLMSSELSSFNHHIESITSFMNVPGQPRIFDPLMLLNFIDQADAEERNTEPPKKTEMIEFDQPLERFDQELVERMTHALQSYLNENRETSFSRLVTWAEKQFESKDEMVCIIYLILQWFGDPSQSDGLDIQKESGKKLEYPGLLFGDELQIVKTLK